MTIVAALMFALAQGDAPLDARVSAYVAQLRDETTRDRARDRLVHLGRPALVLLEKADVDPALLASIRQEIVFHESLGASYGPPHLFTLDGSEESLGVLISRLETAYGATFQKNSFDLGQKLAIKLDDATFWETLDEVCAKGSMWYYPGNDPPSLNGGMASLKPRAYYGPIVAIMGRASQERRITFNAIESDFTIRLMLAWERTIAPLGVNGRFQLTAATDDTGASLLAPPKGPAPLLRSGALIRNPGRILDLSGLKPPSVGSKKLARVEGTFELEFPSRIDEVRFELAPEGPTAGKEKSIDGATVQLKSFTPTPAWTAALTVWIKFQDPKEAADFRIGAADVEYFPAGDQRRSSWIGSAKLEEGTTFTFSGTWRSGGRQELPKEVRIRIPRGVVVKHVPFCFKDVDLK